MPAIRRVRTPFRVDVNQLEHQDCVDGILLLILSSPTDIYCKVHLFLSITHSS